MGGSIETFWAFVFEPLAILFSSVSSDDFFDVIVRPAPKRIFSDALLAFLELKKSDRDGRDFPIKDSWKKTKINFGAKYSGVDFTCWAFLTSFAMLSHLISRIVEVLGLFPNSIPHGLLFL